MPQTPSSGDQPYLTAARIFVYRDERRVLELLRDDGVKAVKDDALDPETEAGERLTAALAAASGEIEEHAQAGGRYDPATLAALTGNSKVRLEQLAASLAFWALQQRRHPDIRAEDVAGAEDALKALDRLRKGETIFGTVEAARAGVGSVTPLGLTDERTTVSAARRYFGNRERRS